MNCHHHYNWKFLTCLLLGNFIRWALFVSPLSSYTLSLCLAYARSERLSLEVDGKVKVQVPYSIT